MGKGERPEHTAPPEIFYNDDEARKYTTNTRIIAIQEKLTQVCQPYHSAARSPPLVKLAAAEVTFLLANSLLVLVTMRGYMAL